MYHFFQYLVVVLYYHSSFFNVVVFHFSSTWANSTSVMTGSAMSAYNHLIGGFGDVSTGEGLQKGLIGLGAGSATAGCLGAGIGQGFSAGKAAEAIGRNPEATDRVRTIMIIGAAIAESGAIYSLLVAIILLFVYGK